MWLSADGLVGLSDVTGHRPFLTARHLSLQAAEEETDAEKMDGLIVLLDHQQTL